MPAVGIGNTSVNTAPGAATVDVTHTNQSANGRVLVAIAHTENNPLRNVSSVVFDPTGSNVAFTQAVNAANSFNRGSIHYLLADGVVPESGTSTIRATMDGTCGSLVCRVYTLTGAKQAAPHDTDSQTSDSADSLTSTINAAIAGALILETCQSGNDAAAIGQTTSQTELVQQIADSVVYNVASLTATQSGDVTITSSLTPANRVMQGVVSFSPLVTGSIYSSVPLWHQYEQLR